MSKDTTKHVYLDMDDVLCDFVGEACKVFGISRKEFEARRTPGHWEMYQYLGVTKKEFWQKIRKEGGVSFWVDMEPTPWFKELLRAVHARFEHWYILTSPDRDPRCYAGKIAWAQKHIGTWYEKIIPFQHKWVLSQKDRVLVDDRFINLIDFEFDKEKQPRGGMGILFPARGNQLHHLCENPVPYVEEKLDAFILQKRKRRLPRLEDLL